MTAKRGAVDFRRELSRVSTRAFDLWRLRGVLWLINGARENEGQQVFERRCAGRGAARLSDDFSIGRFRGAYIEKKEGGRERERFLRAY